MIQRSNGSDNASARRGARCRGFGLRARLMFLVALAFLPLLLLILNNAREERSHALAQDEQRAQTLVHQISDAEERSLHSIHAMLTLLAGAPEVLQGDSARCARLMRSVLAVEPDLANIGVADLRGNVVCSAVPLTHPVNVADRAYFKRALAYHDFAVGIYEVGRITRLPSLVDAHPVPVAGPFKGVAFASMRLKRLAALPANLQLPRGARFSLYDSNDHLLAEYPAVRDAVRRGGGGMPVSIPSGVLRYTGIVRTGGENYLLAYTRLLGHDSGDDLHALLMVPAVDAYAHADAVARHSLELLGVALGIVLLMTWLGSNLLVLRPVRLLIETAQHLAAGRLNMRTGIRECNGEIGQLAEAVDVMADALERRALENEQQAKRIGRLNRTYQVLSAINGAIIRMRDRDELLKEACRIAVEEGDFTFAWVGLIESQSDWLRIVAHAGSAREFIQSVRVSPRADLPQGQGTAGRALRSGTAEYTNDVANDPAQGAWSDAFREAGIQSIASFPLRVRDQTVGVLVFNTDEIGFFDDDEIRLLQEVAADTSLGLEHIERETRLSYLSNWDLLTGLPNRTLLRDRIQQAIDYIRPQAAKLVVMVVDLTNFGEINDVLGRHVGDLVLKEFAARLEPFTQGGDESGDSGIASGRVGSHSFGLLLDVGDDLARAQATAQRLLDVVRLPVAVGDEEVRLTVHIGAAVFPEHGGQGDALLRNAEFAAHSAAAGGVLHFYSEKLDANAQQRRRLEAALQGALGRNEFFLEYQPKVDVHNGRVMGAEALLRWQSPDFGRVEPDRFVPILEQTGLIDEVGVWVLTTAARQVAQWCEVVADGFVMAVNVASSQLFAGDFVAQAASMVRAAGAQPEQIELEITETRLMDHILAGPERLAQLKAQGFHIAIDDFGIGYSSLSYLRDLPLDTLKIDRSFVANIVSDPGALSIVRTVLALARTLRLNVVAEGVEDDAQSALLAAEGCVYVQGFHFSRPLSPEQFRQRCVMPFAVPEPAGADTQRILLIVDDEQNVTQSLRRSLRGEDYRIVTAHGADEAFKVLAQQRVHVVLSDLRMPKMNGTEFLRRVKSMYPNTVRMILTGYNDISTVTTAVNEGAIFKFVSKPWEDAFLRGALREAFEAADAAG